MIKQVEKPWGKEEWWAQTEHYVGKLLHVKARERLSLQYHRYKEETMYLLHGEIKMTLDDHVTHMTPGGIVHIPPNTIHRVEAITDAVIIEVSTPEVDDIVRIHDDYAR